MTVRLSSSSLAGTARTDVAVGTLSDCSMLTTTRAAAPRSCLVSGPPSLASAAGAAGGGEAGVAGREAAGGWAVGAEGAAGAAAGALAAAGAAGAAGGFAEGTWVEVAAVVPVPFGEESGAAVVAVSGVPDEPLRTGSGR